MRTAPIALIAVCLAMFIAQPAWASDDDVAVIIGNRNYQANIPAVEFAHRDADAMRQYAIDVLQIRGGNILDLRDASQAAMQSAFGNDRTHKGKLWRWLKPGKSRVFVFYSGHGVPGLSDRRGYLLPVDADPDAPEINGFPVDVLYRNLEKLDAKSITVFLDACFSGESPRGMLIRSASGIVLTPKLPEKTTRLTVLTAAQGNQVASWDESAQHGLFTRHLLDGLRGAADSTDYGTLDGQITLDELKAYLDDTMTYAARRSYGRVQIATSLGSGDTVVAMRPQRQTSSVGALPRPSAQSISDGQPANLRARHAAAPPPQAAASQQQKLAAVAPAAAPGRPQDFDGEWEVEIVFNVNGGHYRYVEDLTIEGGKFSEYLDVQDIRLGQHTQRNWILEGSVDGSGRFVKSALHYAHVYALVFELDGTLQEAEGTTSAKSWTASLKARKKR